MSTLSVDTIQGQTVAGKITLPSGYPVQVKSHAFDDTTNITSTSAFVDVTGSSNDFELNIATNALAECLDLDWTINGDSNTLDFTIDVDSATSYVDIDGDSNTITYDGRGYADGYF